MEKYKEKIIKVNEIIGIIRSTSVVYLNQMQIEANKIFYNKNKFNSKEHKEFLNKYSYILKQGKVLEQLLTRNRQSLLKYLKIIESDGKLLEKYKILVNINELKTEHEILINVDKKKYNDNCKIIQLILQEIEISKFLENKENFYSNLIYYKNTLKEKIKQLSKVKEEITSGIEYYNENTIENISLLESQINLAMEKTIDPYIIKVGKQENIKKIEAEVDSILILINEKCIEKLSNLNNIDYMLNNYNKVDNEATLAMFTTLKERFSKFKQIINTYCIIDLRELKEKERLTKIDQILSSDKIIVENHVIVGYIRFINSLENLSNKLESNIDYYNDVIRNDIKTLFYATQNRLKRVEQYIINRPEEDLNKLSEIIKKKTDMESKYNEVTKKYFLSLKIMEYSRKIYSFISKFNETFENIYSIFLSSDYKNIEELLNADEYFFYIEEKKEHYHKNRKNNLQEIKEYFFENNIVDYNQLCDIPELKGKKETEIFRRMFPLAENLLNEGTKKTEQNKSSKYNVLSNTLIAINQNIKEYNSNKEEVQQENNVAKENLINRLYNKYQGDISQINKDLIPIIEEEKIREMSLSTLKIYFTRKNISRTGKNNTEKLMNISKFRKESPSLITAVDDLLCVILDDDGLFTNNYINIIKEEINIISSTVQKLPLKKNVIALYKFILQMKKKGKQIYELSTFLESKKIIDKLPSKENNSLSNNQQAAIYNEYKESIINNKGIFIDKNIRDSIMKKMIDNNIYINEYNFKLALKLYIVEELKIKKEKNIIKSNERTRNISE